MKYDIARELAQVHANKSCAKTYVLINEENHNFLSSTRNDNIPLNYSVIETIEPKTGEYVKMVYNETIEDVIEKMKELPHYTIGGQSNYFNASDVMDIVMLLRKFN